MVDNQHKKIRGYRDLTEDEIRMMNEVKAIEREVLDLIDTMQRQHGIDQRWVAIAHTDLQKGFMAAVRAIARPGE